MKQMVLSVLIIAVITCCIYKKLAYTLLHFCYQIIFVRLATPSEEIGPVMYYYSGAV